MYNKMLEISRHFTGLTKFHGQGQIARIIKLPWSSLARLSLYLAFEYTFQRVYYDWFD